MADGMVVDREHPWPWLDPFTESAAHYFNGRDADADMLERAVLARPVCVLFGKSGLGKTSLLLAGLFPRLRGRRLLPVALRRIEQATDAPALSAQMRHSLDEAAHEAGLARRGELPPGEADDTAALWELLHDTRRPLVDADGATWTPVFVLDQFEEVFTLQPDERLRLKTFRELGDLLENRVPPGVAARLDLHDELLDRIDVDAQPYRVVLALREDFLPELENWTQLVPRLASNRCRLLPMSTDQALEAVRKTGGALVDAEAARTIVDFLGRQASARGGGSRRIEPSLLSLICASLNADRLARRPPGVTLDVSDLEVRGAQILDRFYDDAFAALPSEQREGVARWIEANLITEGGTRRPFPLDAIERALEAPLRHLVNRRLVRIESSERGDQVELVHDRLAAVAFRRAQSTQEQAEREQRLLREKEAAERELLRQKAAAAEEALTDEMAQSLMAEQEAQRERQRATEALVEARRIRRLSALLGGLLVCSAAIATWAVWERQRAVEARRVAQDALEIQRQSSEQVQRQYAERQAIEAEVESARSTLARVNAVLNSNRPDASSAATALIGLASRTLAGTAPAASAAAMCANRRLYPHVADRSDLALLDSLSPELRRAGFIVLRTEVVPAERMPATPEVRYFRPDDEQGAIAATVALARAGLPGVPARYVKGFETSPRVQPCQLELWLAVRERVLPMR